MFHLKSTQIITINYKIIEFMLIKFKFRPIFNMQLELKRNCVLPCEYKTLARLCTKKNANCVR